MAKKTQEVLKTSSNIINKKKELQIESIASGKKSDFLLEICFPIQAHHNKTHKTNDHICHESL